MVVCLVGIIPPPNHIDQSGRRHESNDAKIISSLVDIWASVQNIHHIFIGARHACRWKGGKKGTEVIYFFDCHFSIGYWQNEKGREVSKPRMGQVPPHVQQPQVNGTHLNPTLVSEEGEINVCP